MTPLTRSEQSRINGAKSKGPTSAAGKAISSANALKHGFAATINIVLTIEDETEFHEHLAGVRASYNPTNYVERTYVDQLASITWRQARLVALESALIEAQMSLHETKLYTTHPNCADDRYFQLVQAWRGLASPPRPRTEAQEIDTTLPPSGYDMNSMELLRRYQTSLDRQHRNTLLNLTLYRKNFAPAAAAGNANLPIGSASKQEEPETPPPPPLKKPPQPIEIRIKTPEPQSITTNQPKIINPGPQPKR